MSGRQSKVEKEREKAVQDRVQTILTAMLKDEDNKYCVDCDSKGPRWASWNLGIFLCIRCAGIHRNLGVHISKVKSVNLDSWTLQQVASVQQMGNKQARAVYEAGMPEDFRRPQTDQAVEAFVRQKYEKKKFLLAGWEPSKPPIEPAGWAAGEQAAAVKARTEVAKKVVVPAKSPPAPATARPVTAPAAVPPSASADLLGLMSGPAPPGPSPALPSSASSDLLGLQAEFGDFTSAAPAASASADLFAGLGGGSSQPQAAAPADAGKMSTDSIMALFGPAAAPATMFPAVQQQQLGNNNMFGQAGGLTAAQQQTAAANNPFLADAGLLHQLGGLGLGQGQASLWQ